MKLFEPTLSGMQDGPFAIPDRADALSWVATAKGEIHVLMQ
jgi:hypothetical protein